MQLAWTLALASLAVATVNAQGVAATQYYPVVENNFDFVDHDLTNVTVASVAGCDAECAKVTGCNAYSWSVWDGKPTCWLKSARDKIIFKSGVKSSGLYTTQQVVGTTHADVDIVGNDIASKKAKADECLAICQVTDKCRAYTWTDHEEGTCWLKSGRGAVVAKTGAISADAYPNDAEWVVHTLLENTDFTDHDIGSKPSKTALGCVDICKTVAGCRAFAWTNLNGGTCWLKSGKGTVIYKQGVTAGEVTDRPTTLCTWEDGKDVFTKDLSNVPGIGNYESCCTICQDTKDCKAVSWSNYRGGTCWLKKETTEVVTLAGVKLTVVAAPAPASL